MTCGSQIRNYPEIVKYFNADELMEGTTQSEELVVRTIIRIGMRHQSSLLPNKQIIGTGQ
jgi:hypothetical protein